MPRTTTELVVVILAAAVAAVLVLVTVGLVFIADPDDPAVRAVADAAGGVASLMVGIVVGYLLRARKNGP